MRIVLCPDCGRDSSQIDASGLLPASSFPNAFFISPFADAAQAASVQASGTADGARLGRERRSGAVSGVAAAKAAFCSACGGCGKSARCVGAAPRAALCSLDKKTFSNYEVWRFSADEV